MNDELDAVLTAQATMPGWRFALSHAVRLADSISEPNLNALTGRPSVTTLRKSVMRPGSAG